jgi:hypothetical protein
LACFINRLENLMLSQLNAKLAAVYAAAGASLHHRLNLLALAVLATAFVGCAQPILPLANADPADARAPVPPVSYRSATASYKSMRPSAPGPWRQQNDSVAQ